MVHPDCMSVSSSGVGPGVVFGLFWLRVCRSGRGSCWSIAMGGMVVWDPMLPVAITVFCAIAFFVSVCPVHSCARVAAVAVDMSCRAQSSRVASIARIAACWPVLAQAIAALYADV